MFYCVFRVNCGFVNDLFFFFKQKTAYEMRISDWSSDVCSSDLGSQYWAQTGDGGSGNLLLQAGGASGASGAGGDVTFDSSQGPVSLSTAGFNAFGILAQSIGGGGGLITTTRSTGTDNSTTQIGGVNTTRSEEHTSELQSLMPI